MRESDKEPVKSESKRKSDNFGEEMENGKDAGKI